MIIGLQLQGVKVDLKLVLKLYFPSIMACSDLAILIALRICITRIDY